VLLNKEADRILSLPPLPPHCIVSQV